MTVGLIRVLGLELLMLGLGAWSADCGPGGEHSWVRVLRIQHNRKAGVAVLASSGWKQYASKVAILSVERAVGL